MMLDAPADRVFTTREVVRWWEFRRPLFNLVWLVVGLSSIAAMESLLAPLIPEGQEVADSVTLTIVMSVYGVLLNLCYTLGWIVELREQKQHGKIARERGRLLFQVMLAFSLILASGPLWYGCAFWIIHRGDSR